MSKGFYIDDSGLKSVIARLKALNRNVERIVEAEVADSAQAIERTAVQFAPKDMGSSGLAGSIKARQETALQWEVIAGVFYAPYIEFGTGKKVQIPAGLEQYAAQFKGKRQGGGSWKEFVRKIYEWMKRNGIHATDADTTTIKSGKNKGNKRVSKVDQNAADLAYAYNIARSIYLKGISPRPFLFPAYNQEKEKLKKRLLAELKNALKR